MAINLALSWWALALRGAAAILFGILALIFPPSAVAALILLFGAWALLDGVFTLMAAARAPRAGKRWGSLAFQGAVSVLAGLVAFFWTGLTALALVMLIGAWSIIIGAAEIAAAVRLRRQIEGEWLLGLSGVLSVLFGILLLIAPGAGMVALAIWIGAYAIALGVLLVALALRLRSWARGSEQPFPQGARTI
jgi:uncharacterized membrane protein HdeD (DUF308 family)